MRKSIQYKNLLLYFFKLLTFINRYVYKEPKKIVLYSNLGFRDNVKAVFDYLIENQYNEHYKIICSINDLKKCEAKNIKNVYYTNNIFGIFHFMTSRYFFYCFGKYPIKPSINQVVVNLWHGTPLKKIGNLESGKENIDYNYFSIILAASEAFKPIMKEAFNCQEENVVICGHPRNDELFKDNSKLLLAPELNKIILWLPTFRKSDTMSIDNETTNNIIPIFKDVESMESLNKSLMSNNVSLIVKIHPIQNIEGLNIRGFSNIEIMTNDILEQKKINLYQLLSRADALITDYSSVYFDYLLLDRPIAFTVDDIDLYESKRGFVFDDARSYMPGMKIENEVDFYKFLDDFYLDRDYYKEERRRINEFSNYYKDDQNCKRILEIVGIYK